MKLKSLIHAATASLLLGVTVIGYQFATTMKDSDRAREVAIQEWVGENPDGYDAVTRYRETCQGGSAQFARNQRSLRPITLAECAAQIGNASLAEIIEHAADSVVIPAPLRWL